MNPEKTFSPEQQELLDLAILRVMDANRTRFGLGVPAITHLITMYGFSGVHGDTIADRLDYHCAKTGFVEEVQKVANRANRAWRVTAAGIDYVDNHP